MPTARDRIRKHVKRVVKEIHRMNGVAKETAQEKLREIRKQGSNRYEEGRDKVQQLERRVGRLIRDRPLRSIY